MNAMRVLANVATRDIHTSITRFMKYTNGAWNDSHRR